MIMTRILALTAFLLLSAVALSACCALGAQIEVVTGNDVCR
jgi:hypothetical protein